MASENLRNVIMNAQSGQPSILPSPSATRYIESVKIPQTGIRRNRKEVINGIWNFTQHFEGHENNAQQDKSEIWDPLEVPISNYLDFFAAAEQIYTNSKNETSELHFWNPGKKKQLRNIRNNIGEDAERVAEALVYSIADLLSDSNPMLARLLGKLDSSLDIERLAEGAHDTSTMVWASSTGSALQNQNAALIGMVSTGDNESRTENKRVRNTNAIVDEISPILKEMNLYDPIKEWVGFSNL